MHRRPLLPTFMAAAKRARLEKVELKSAFDKDGIVVSMPPNWHCAEDSVLISNFKDPKPSVKVAAFDFDGCLCNTKFGFDPKAWSLRYASVPKKLRALSEEGYKVVIFTNEVSVVCTALDWLFNSASCM